jgi:hypothetical protein
MEHWALSTSVRTHLTKSGEFRSPYMLAYIVFTTHSPPLMASKLLVKKNFKITVFVDAYRGFKLWREVKKYFKRFK